MLIFVSERNIWFIGSDDNHLLIQLLSWKANVLFYYIVTEFCLLCEMLKRERERDTETESVGVCVKVYYGMVVRVS